MPRAERSDRRGAGPAARPRPLAAAAATTVPRRHAATPPTRAAWRARMLCTGLAVTLLAGCASRRLPGDDAPTLASLAGRRVDVQADAGGIARDEARAIAAYQAFLQVAPGASAERAAAMRRLGDLEMERADRRAGEGSPGDFAPAVALYQRLLAEHPQAEGRAEVLYQLARAHELSGDLPAAQAALDRLVAEHPNGPQREEAEFRRGELLFGQRRFAEAEQAFGTVLRAGAGSSFLERALFMQGWSRYKQGRLPEALESFFGVLDLTLHDGRDAALSRGEQELVDDTLRVVALSLDAQGGSARIAEHISSPRRAGYEWRVVQRLGELYLQQGRRKDAADNFARFARARGDAPEAHGARERVVEIYDDGGFQQAALAAREDYVRAYGPGSGWQPATPLQRDGVRLRVGRYLAELSRHHHARAQRTRDAADVDAAVHWYRVSLAHADDAPTRFLLGELLVDSGRHAEALQAYEAAAYDAPLHGQSAEAGYAALLAHAELLRRAPADRQPEARRAMLRSEERFAERFATDPRAVGVLAHAAEVRYALHDAPGAARLAARVLQAPGVGAEQRRVALTVQGHAAFDAGAFEDAERAYRAALALPGAPPQAVGERLAAAVYRQGEAARERGQATQAVALFQRAADLAVADAAGTGADGAPGRAAGGLPGGPVGDASGIAAARSIGASARLDAAALLIGQRDWAGAVQQLEALRREHAAHPMAAEAGPRLALAYGELGRHADAAREYAALAPRLADPEAARAARWAAAESLDKAGDRAGAQQAYESYLRAHAQPLAAATEARWRLAGHARERGRVRDETRWLQALRDAVRDAGPDAGRDAVPGAGPAPAGSGAAAPDAGRPGGARVRELAALAALRLTEPQAVAYRQVALKEPLARNLALKQKRLDALLAAYGEAVDGAGAEATSAARYLTAEAYREFGRAVLASERPRGLPRSQRATYETALQQQAQPFADKAGELHAANAQLAAQGSSGEWVRKSQQALRELGRSARPATAAAVAAQQTPGLEP